ncbi:hypothetical protein RJ639_027711 [Escallonia herrerae]|uniref:Gag-pol polyprotein n=1 Tax=Escallonia herrerae TaxID=1293975 RepID=A0AA88X447_9ASTE|nr:hypothetical protein RJ639_027711 [Escallonia herrerae]
MAIVERLEDFEQGERPRSPRHKYAKDRGDGRSKTGSHKATDDEQSGTRDVTAITKGRRSIREVTSGHKGSNGDSSNSNGEARMGELQMFNAFVQKSKEEAAKGKKSKKRRDLLYVMVDVVGNTQEAHVDTGAILNFMSPRVEWLRLKPTKDGGWFTVVNAKERLAKGVVKNVDLRINEWTGNADFNIIDMDELGVVLGIDFMEKSSTRLNPYCRVMMMVECIPTFKEDSRWSAFLPLRRMQDGVPEDGTEGILLFSYGVVY